MTQTQTNNPERLKIASSIAGGLLASQNPDKGWNVAALAIISLRVADELMHYHQMDDLPEIKNPN
jgi:hypothetical protein